MGIGVGRGKEIERGRIDQATQRVRAEEHHTVGFEGIAVERADDLLAASLGFDRLSKVLNRFGHAEIGKQGVAHGIFRGIAALATPCKCFGRRNFGARLAVRRLDPTAIGFGGRVKSAVVVRVEPLLRLAAADLPAADAVGVVGRADMAHGFGQQLGAIAAKRLGKERFTHAGFFRHRTLGGMSIRPPPRHADIDARKNDRIRACAQSFAHGVLEFAVIGLGRIVEHADAERRKAGIAAVDRQSRERHVDKKDAVTRRQKIGVGAALFKIGGVGHGGGLVAVDQKPRKPAPGADRTRQHFPSSPLPVSTVWRMLQPFFARRSSASASSQLRIAQTMPTTRRRSFRLEGARLIIIFS